MTKLRHWALALTLVCQVMGAIAQVAPSPNQIAWTDWTFAVPGNFGVATGKVKGIGLQFSGPIQFAQTRFGQIFGNGADSLINYWAEFEPRPYTSSPLVANPPPPYELVALNLPGANALSFDKPVVNPIMAILSLGRNNLPVTYQFDTPFRVLSEGKGYWGDGSFTTAPGNTLTGRELHAVIQFQGTVQKINWISAPEELWHGFTVGLSCGDKQISEQITYTDLCRNMTSTQRLRVKWGKFGEKEILEADSGDTLEVRCVSHGGANSFEMYYTPKAGKAAKVGKCPFADACNIAFILHSGDEDKNGKPDCLLQTNWVSRDYGADDKPNPWLKADGIPELPGASLDYAQTLFDVTTKEIIRRNISYEYRIAPPINWGLYCPNPSAANGPEGKIRRIIELDPPIGPETEAFFDRVTTAFMSLPDRGQFMGFSNLSLADLNRDGRLDHLDLEAFQRTFGKCAGDPDYDPQANFDKDNCVTFKDYQIWLQFFNAR